MSFASLKRLVVALSAFAALGASLAATTALASMRIGEIDTFTLNDIDKIGTINAMLNAKLGHDVMATGGTLKRVSASRFLFCGYYLDDSSDKSNTAGFVIVHDQRSPAATEVLAPITHAEQERRGCWPGERARLDAEVRHILRLAKASKGVSTTTQDVGRLKVAP